MSSYSNPPPRIQRWLLRLQAYKYTIKYHPGNQSAAGVLSRNPVSAMNYDDSAHQHIHFVSTHAMPKTVNMDEIRVETAKDQILTTVLQTVTANDWDKKNPLLKERHELSIQDDIILKGNQIVIPTSLQERILQIAHKQQQGVNKTKALLRQNVWWPNFSNHVEQLIQHCHTCQINTTSITKSGLLKMSEILQHPWDKVAIDLKGPIQNGEHLLAFVDYHSRCHLGILLKYQMLLLLV